MVTDGAHIRVGMLLVIVLLGMAIILQCSRPREAVAQSSCDDVRALKEIARQSRRQTAALERIAEKLE